MAGGSHMDDLFSRSKKMLKAGKPYQLVGTERSVQFLRGVFSRATLCLPALYYLMGTAYSKASSQNTNSYSSQVAECYLEFSSLNTLSLSCRKVFDHGKKPDLTGANFGKLSDTILDEHAAYWSHHSGKTKSECIQSLVFLRHFFSEYSKTPDQLLKVEGYLHKRIGLLKQHADRSAAHLSLEDYSLNIFDMVHFTSSIVIVGEIVRSFDRPDLSDKYFNEIDVAAYEGAKKVFPQIEEFQIFSGMEICHQARSYWRYHQQEDIQSLFDQLQYALG